MRNSIVIISAVLCLLNWGCERSNNVPEVVVTTLTETRVEIERGGLLFETLTNLNDSNIFVCAHRAFYRDFPENSIASIQAAIDEGIDMVEIDVRTTSDSILVLMHDATIDRTTTGQGNIKSQNWNDTKELKLLHRENPTIHSIPKLERVFQLFKDKNIFINLDLKDADNKALTDLIKEYGMLGQVMCYNSKRLVHLEILDLKPQLITMPLCKEKVDIDFYLKNIDPVVLHYSNSSFTESLLQLAKRDGVKVFMNALGDIDSDISSGNYASLVELLRGKPNIIQTDFPKLLLSYLRQHGLHE